jgi:hypothetical protein
MEQNDSAPNDRVPFSLLSDVFQADPPAMFAAMRDKCPVHHAT